MTWDYISGFFDADGYVTFTRVQSDQQKSPCIGFTNNELNILTEIKAFIYTELGINGFICGKKAPNKSSNINYDLKYTHLTKILLLAGKIQSVHNKKIHRLKLIQDRCQEITPRNGKYNADLLEKRASFEADFFKVL